MEVSGTGALCAGGIQTTTAAEEGVTPNIPTESTDNLRLSTWHICHRVKAKIRKGPTIPLYLVQKPGFSLPVG
ncbi:hypothetical protein BO94DRAFT_540569 [Aspergillus sclerotioniger CBS 115572]|uniref:Uncharacterized protein n=1 Tax=Aspergillus sclerotioniger CBS 115572 TaxID=1450535 RepID=A0A317V160_9EURO|nr:hypothetical protein BO94DRAFT_540569 [Aspergillus sclerotioniger CBS 115572]PWY66818.1 hypothetical protein BO94DRAFT_540569 [Aspergillus sclerotioniger CBS 115572]